MREKKCPQKARQCQDSETNFIPKNRQIAERKENYHTKSSEEIKGEFFFEKIKKTAERKNRRHSVDHKNCTTLFFPLFARKNSFFSFQIPWTRIVIFLNIITLHSTSSSPSRNLLRLCLLSCVQGEKFFFGWKIIIIVFPGLLSFGWRK